MEAGRALEEQLCARLRAQLFGRVVGLGQILLGQLADAFLAVVTFNNVSLAMLDITRRVNEARRTTWALAKGIDLEKLKLAERKNRKQAKPAGAGGNQKGNMPPGAKTAQTEGWAAFAWKHNALRHSFISYRVADIQNVAQVALEAGNSPQMIFQHYRELVRPAAAKEWFAIEPNAQHANGSR